VDRTRPAAEPPAPGSKKRFLFVAALLLLAFLAQGMWFLDANSQTSDEAVHLVAGYSYLATRDFRLNPEHPPLIKELAALPVYLWYRIPFQPDAKLWSYAEQWFLGSHFLYDSPVSGDSILRLARLPNLLLGTVLVALVGWWAYRLWGPWAGIVAMALAAFEPNIVANACLVTTDLGITLFVFLTVYLTWEHVRSPSRWRLLAIGLAMGLALVTKFSAITLPLTLAAVMAGVVVTGGSFRKGGPGDGESGLRHRVQGAGLAWLVVLAVGILVIPFAYFFSDFTSWLSGARTVLAHQGLGHPAFFLGEYSQDGWWSYFLVAFLIKTPVGSLFLILAGLLLYRRGKPLNRRDVVFLLVTPALLMAAASYGRINIGVRHILPIYPFLFVATSRLATVRWKRPALGAVALGLPLLLTGLSTLRAAPHHLAYFNELVGFPGSVVQGGSGQGFRYLGDSNIDWGQDLRGLSRYMKRESIPMIYLSYFGNVRPETYGIRYQYLPAYGYLARPAIDVLPPGTERELLAISVYNLQGVHFADHDLYDWLREREPLTRIGNSIHIYDVTDDAESHFGMAKAYWTEGPWELALPELRKVLAVEPGNEEARLMLSVLSQVPQDQRNPQAVPEPFTEGVDP
jgi:hypothetical protein